MIIRFASSLLVLAVFMAFIACSQQPGSGGNSSSAGIGSSSAGITISGTITLPALQTGSSNYITLYTNSANGFITNVRSVTAGDSISYSIGNLPVGNYFIISFVDNNSDRVPGPGDYFCTYPFGTTTNLTEDSIINFTQSELH